MAPPLMTPAWTSEAPMYRLRSAAALPTTRSAVVTPLRCSLPTVSMASMRGAMPLPELEKTSSSSLNTMRLLSESTSCSR